MAVVRLTIACQCPLSGFFHFYYTKDAVYTHGHNTRVNALYRASSISTGRRAGTEIRSTEGVNALYRASSISTEKKYFKENKEYESVNALYRASSISTGQE